ncbi:MAG: TonB-dependent receptor [Ignavibacteriaceae bacterium]|nr:TonB-dependent receptor [Ignavibacteriaceae bacterium]
MKLVLRLSFLASLILLFSNPNYGQGSLRGSIVDSLTSKPLVGANVFLVGTAMGAATDIEGTYSVKSIPEGKYSVKVSYLGYKSTLIEVFIQDDKTTKLDVQLSPDIIEGEEVVVTGQLMGQMSAINQQRTSNTIINVVSEEKIKELPDANAAESIGRLPGVSILRSGGEANKVILRGLEDKFTVITIDGMKVPPTDATGRGIDLSMISQSALSGIELYKALTSDKDGDALAGSINLVTKMAPEIREIRADLKGDYNSLMNSLKQYDFSVHYGERFFDGLLGVQLNGNLENRIRSNERVNVNYSFDQGFGGDYFINNFLLEFTDEIRKRDGFSLLLDFKTPDDGTIRFNNVYGRTKRDYLWSYREYTSNGGGNYDGPAYDYRDREQEIKTFNSSIRGDNNLFGFKLNWSLSFAQSESYFPYDYEAIFVEDNGMNASPKLKEKPEQLVNYAVNNYLNASLDWAYLRTQDNFDKERTGFLDISRPYVFGDILSGEVKFGGKYRIKDRSNSRTEDFTPYYLGRWMSYERLPDGTFRLKDFTGTYFEDWWKLGGGAIGLNQFFTNLETRDIYGSYPLNPLIIRDRLRQWQSLNQYGVNSSGSTLPNAQEVWENPLIKFDDYNIRERVSAGYLMNTLNFGQFLTLIAGLRVENEDNDYTSYYMLGSVGGFPVDPGRIRDTTSSSNQSILLPNVNLAFKPYDFMNIRFAVYKALARPDFNMRLDRYIAGRPAEASSQPQVYVGNIGLKTAQAWNFEINTSFFGNEIGLISFSAYYKEIKDMFHMLNNFNTAAVRINGVLQEIQYFGVKWPSNMGTTPYNLTLPYNSPKPTKVWGFEFEHQMNFHFLPGLLKNIVLSYNASIVRSETTIYGSKTISYIDSSGIIPLRKSRNILIERTQKLEGMPEFFGNISLGYDYEGFSARFSLFHKGSHNVSFSASGSADQVTKPFTRLDIALKQKVNDFLAVFININNVTNVEDGNELTRRQYGYTLFDRSEKYGLTLDFGATLQL